MGFQDYTPEKFREISAKGRLTTKERGAYRKPVVRDQCMRGHELIDDNVYIRRRPRISKATGEAYEYVERICKLCVKENSRLRYLRNRARRGKNEV